MATAATNSFPFSHFLSLPSELRNKIWLYVLPDKDEPALYFFRKGCWSPRRLKESDQRYDPNDEYNLTLEFRHDLLEPARVDVPLFFVNHETRGIALAWVCAQGIEMCFYEGGKCHMFVRPFDPMRDVLYIAPGRWNDFCFEPYDRLYEPDLLGKNVSNGPSLTCIAVPESLVWGGADALPEMFGWLPGIEVLLVIVDPQPSVQLPGREVVQRFEEAKSMQKRPSHLIQQLQGDDVAKCRWEIKSTRGRAFFWNREHGRFDVGDGDCIGSEALYKHIEAASKGLGEKIIENHKRRFEIRPVYAIKR